MILVNLQLLEHQKVQVIYEWNPPGTKSSQSLRAAKLPTSSGVAKLLKISVRRVPVIPLHFPIFGSNGSDRDSVSALFITALKS